MPATSSYDYAIIRLVPNVERGEFINVGAILFCRTKRFLSAKVQLSESRLQAFAPQLEIGPVRAYLDLFPKICAGAGPIGQLPQADRFHWLVAPRSTILQTSPVHTGFCQSPEDALARVFETMVADLTGF